MRESSQAAETMPKVTEKPDTSGGAPAPRRPREAELLAEATANGILADAWDITFSSASCISEAEGLMRKLCVNLTTSLVQCYDEPIADHDGHCCMPDADGDVLHGR